MFSHVHPWFGKRAFLTALLLAIVAAAGCDTSPGLVGKWDTLDRSDLMRNPATAENDLANLLSPVPNFSLKFAKDGTCVCSWKGADGKNGSKSGTWKLLEDRGLKWRITLKVPPDEEEWEVKVGSPELDKLSLEGVGDFGKGGAIYFKRG